MENKVKDFKVLATGLNVFAVQLSKGCWNAPSRMSDKLHFRSPNSMTKAQCLLGLFRFVEDICQYLVCCSINLHIWKCYSHLFTRQPIKLRALGGTQSQIGLPTSLDCRAKGVITCAYDPVRSRAFVVSIIRLH